MHTTNSAPVCAGWCVRVQPPHGMRQRGYWRQRLASRGICDRRLPSHPHSPLEAPRFPGSQTSVCLCACAYVRCCVSVFLRVCVCSHACLLVLECWVFSATTATSLTTNKSITVFNTSSRTGTNASNLALALVIALLL